MYDLLLYAESCSKAFDAMKLNDCTQSDSHAHVYLMK